MPIKARDFEVLSKMEKALAEARTVAPEYPKWLSDLNYCYGYFHGRLNPVEVLDET